MPVPNKRVFFGNYVFDVWDDVYEPSEDTALFAENLVVCQGDRVLDVGTGCGVLAVMAAERARTVVAMDVNPYALRCAFTNVKLNHLSQEISFVRGDLLTWLKMREEFDLVLFNAPYLPTAEKDHLSWIERAWAGGLDGRRVIDRFISQVPSHVSREGRVLLLQSTLADVEETVRAFQTIRWRAEVIAQRSLPFFETIKLIEARP